MVDVQFPNIWWSQNDSTLFISIEAFDVDRDNIVCKVDGAKFMIRLAEKISDTVKEAELELFGDLIDESKRIEITGSRVGYFFEKKEKKEWDSLLKEPKYKNKIRWDSSRLNNPERGAGGFDGMDGMDFSNMMGGQDFGDDADFPTPDQDDDEDEGEGEDESAKIDSNDNEVEVKGI